MATYSSRIEVLLIFRVVRRADEPGTGESLVFDVPVALAARIVVFVETGEAVGDLWEALVETRVMLDRLKVEADAEAGGLHELDRTNREALAAQCLRLQYQELETPALKVLYDAMEGPPDGIHVLEWRW